MKPSPSSEPKTEKPVKPSRDPNAVASTDDDDPGQSNSIITDFIFYVMSSLIWYMSSRLTEYMSFTFFRMAKRPRQSIHHTGFVDMGLHCYINTVDMLLLSSQ